MKFNCLIAATLYCLFSLPALANACKGATDNHSYSGLYADKTLPITIKFDADPANNMLIINSRIKKSYKFSFTKNCYLHNKTPHITITTSKGIIKAVYNKDDFSLTVNGTIKGFAPLNKALLQQTS